MADTTTVGDEATSASGSTPSSQKRQQDNDRAFYDSLNAMRKANAHTNVVIECNGFKFPAHHYLLACGSRYFYAAFAAGLHERCRVIEMNEYEPVILEVLLEYIYTGTVDLAKVPIEKLEMLVLSGQELQVDDLEKCLLRELIANLNELNFKKGLFMARYLNDREAELSIVTYLSHNLELVCGTADFLDLDERLVQRVVKMAAKERDNHDLLLETMLLWVKRDADMRDDSLARIVVYIDFGKVSRDMATSVLYDKVVYTKPPLKEEIVRVIQSGDDTPHSVIVPVAEEEEEEDGANATAPTNTSWDRSVTVQQTAIAEVEALSPILFFAARNEYNSCILIEYNVQSGEWGEPDDLGISLEHKPGIGYWDNQMLFVGGVMVNNTKMNTASVYERLGPDFRRHKNQSGSRRIINLPQLRIRREKPIVMAFDGVLFALGGSGRYCEGLSHGEYLASLQSTTWRVLPPMRERRLPTATACILKGAVYISGGGSLDVERLKMADKSWDMIPALDKEEFLDDGVLLVAASGRVCALRPYKPMQLHVFDEVKNGWHALHIRGVGPEWVTHCVGFGATIFAVDRLLKLHQLDAGNCQWLPLVKCPKCLAHVEFLTCL